MERSRQRALFRRRKFCSISCFRYRTWREWRLGRGFFEFVNNGTSLEEESSQPCMVATVKKVFEFSSISRHISAVSFTVMQATSSTADMQLVLHVPSSNQAPNRFWCRTRSLILITTCLPPLHSTHHIFTPLAAHIESIYIQPGTPVMIPRDLLLGAQFRYAPSSLHGHPRMQVTAGEEAATAHSVVELISVLFHSLPDIVN